MTTGGGCDDARPPRRPGAPASAGATIRPKEHGRRSGAPAKPGDLDLEGRLRRAQNDPRMVEAALALQRNELPAAERLLKRRLDADRNDVAALRMLAELAARLGRLRESQELLERTLELAPDFAAARLNYATVLHRRNLLPAALDELDLLLAAEPGNPGVQTLKAAVLARAGEYASAIELYETVLRRHPDQARLWMSMGHALKTVGRQEDSVAAYRTALSLDQGLGEAWWSLANLKVVRFEQSDIAAMSAATTRPRTAADLYHLHFALGKGLEDAREFETSFKHYALGASLRRQAQPYDAERTGRHLSRSRRLMTPAAFEARAGKGLPDRAPIFVVGLPRSGSTLVEQILASHSQVEGTMELPDLGIIARDLATPCGGRSDPDDYLSALLACDGDALAALGRRYVDRTRIQRKTGRPHFVDKMPSNFEHVGLIRLILPGAKIIDVRRHPMASCFSAFKQHFSRGQAFTYSLDDLGAYYRDYVALLDHYDEVVPGAVHRVRYEDLVRDPEGQIAALLAHCGLGYERSCVDFHLTERPVRTASSEQVRRPLTATAVDHWRNYEPWLEPLRLALGDTIVRHERAM